MSYPEHHHFQPEDLSRLEWSPCRDLEIRYSAPRGSRIDRITPGEKASLNGYHEATFPIGPNEVGYALIPDSALDLLLILDARRASATPNEQ